MQQTFTVSLDSERYYTVDGKIPVGKAFDELSDIFKTKDGYVRLHTNFPQYVPHSFNLLKQLLISRDNIATNKVYSTSSSASPPRPRWQPPWPNGPRRNSKRSPSSDTSAQLRCVRSKLWTRRLMGYTKRTSTQYRSPRLAMRPSACSVVLI